MLVTLMTLWLRDDVGQKEVSPRNVYEEKCFSVQRLRYPVPVQAEGLLHSKPRSCTLDVFSKPSKGVVP